MRLLRLTFILFIAIFLSSIIFTVFFDTKKPTVSINRKTFNIEIPRSNEQKELGLARYKTIAKDFGMLFIFENKDYYSFWMKSMKFPIDIIFISDNKITTIYKNVDYPKKENEKLKIYKPDVASDMVFEINAGLSDKFKFKKGDSVKINY